MCYGGFILLVIGIEIVNSLNHDVNYMGALKRNGL